jgi:L-seryl-tRNA(Ser) seleniumtransferase
VDALLRRPAIAALGEGHPRSLLVRAVREAVAEERRRAGTEGQGHRDTGAQAHRRTGARAHSALGGADWNELVAARLEALTTPTLRRCVNATGVVLHTNLGRAPLAAAAMEAIAAAAAGYSSLEYDAATGTRGSRHVHGAALLRELTGAEDALVVNNAAGALVLALAASAAGGAAVVSRGELIEIGGGFRIPEIMETSGARLVEVGTTNRTRVADYARVLARAGTGAPGHGGTAKTVILKVHRSNFRLVGFTEEATLEELVALGKRRHAPVLFDLGGGLMLDLSDAGLTGEPTVRDGVKAGAAVTLFSGDKLLGGPQAGILVGTKRFVAGCRAHPLARAMRADKLTLAGLAATLRLYRDPAAARREIPALAMLTAGTAALEAEARRLAALLPEAARAQVVPTRAAVGGGAFPGFELDSWGVALRPDGLTPSTLATRLRSRAVPVVATVTASRLVLDVRTLLPGDAEEVVRALHGTL